MDYRSISRTVYRVGDFLSWQRTGSLILSPSFQRRSVWPQPAKSFLIDTVARGLPIPIVFLRERAHLKTLEPIREVVDGQQRLRTLIAYIEPSLLPDFDRNKDVFPILRQHNPELAGKKFKDLEPPTRQRILNYEFSVQVLPSDTDDREVLQIFARMNATGVKLNAQELRNAQFFGAFKKVAYQLAYEQLSRWRLWKVFSETDIARMLEVEETSDLILMMLEGLHGKSPRSLDGVYKEFEVVFPHEAEAIRRFRATMQKIEDLYGDLVAKSPLSRKVLFNTLFTFIYDLMYGLKTPMGRAKSKPVPLKVRRALDIASEKVRQEDLSEELAKVLRGSTAHLASRRVRLSFLQGVYKSVKT